MTDQISPEKPRGPVAKSADMLDSVARPLRNVTIVLAGIGVIWTTATSGWGDLWKWWNEPSPVVLELLEQVSENNEKLDKLIDLHRVLSARVSFLEEYYPLPKIVNWEAHRVIGVCRQYDCKVRHVISRTEYGSGCGVPVATAEYKQGNEVERLDLPGFSEVKATVRGIRATVPLGFDRTTPPGDYQYRFKNSYPNCSWQKDRPADRVSPWFDITVEAKANAQ